MIFSTKLFHIGYDLILGNKNLQNGYLCLTSCAIIRIHIKCEFYAVFESDARRCCSDG